MACTQSLTLNGIAEECAKAVGGVRKVYIALRDDIDEITLDADETLIESITMKTGKKFKTYEFHKNTANMNTETEAPDDDYPQFNTTVSMVFSKMDTAKRVEMMALALSDTAAIVETVEGAKFYLGYNMGLLISAMTGETGTMYSDKNQYTLSLVDHAEQLPYIVEMEASDFAAIVDPANV